MILVNCKSCPTNGYIKSRKTIINGCSFGTRTSDFLFRHQIYITKNDQFRKLIVPNAGHTAHKGDKALVFDTIVKFKNTLKSHRCTDFTSFKSEVISKKNI